MATRLSDYLNVTPAALRKHGVFDALVGLDSKLFVDPHLLRRMKIPELRHARLHFERHFQQILLLLTNSRRKGDIAWREAERRLVFKETRGVSLGYGVSGGDGNAIGPVLGHRLLETASQIVELGITDPNLFELLALFEEGFGADRLSDMTIAVIRDDLFNYSARVCKKLHIKTLVTVESTNGRFRLAAAPDQTKPLIFIPKKALRPLPVALSYDEIDNVVAYNAILRNRLNQLIGRYFKRGLRAMKAALRAEFLENPQSLSAFIDSYKSYQAQPYDVDLDPNGFFQWFDLGRDYARNHPVEIALKRQHIAELVRVVDSIIQQFQKSIEQSGLNRHLFDDEGVPRHEQFSQRLFYAIADAYCAANNLDLSREPNAGNGPVDFKLSSGYHGRVLVEIKLSSNPHVLRGYERQLPAYEQSEGTQESAYIIIRVGRSDRAIKKVKSLNEQAIKGGRKVPKVYVIDGRIMPTASKR